MGAKTVEKLVAYQFALEFKDEVYQLIRRSSGAQRDLRFRSQLEDALSGIERSIAEGYGRRSAPEFANFLRYSLASLEEAITCIKDGVDRGYYDADACARALLWGQRCRRVTEGLRRSQLRLAELDRQERAQGRAPRRPSRRPL